MYLFLKAVKRGEGSEGPQDACTEPSDWAAWQWGCLKPVFLKKEDTSAWRRMRTYKSLIRRPVELLIRDDRGCL